MFHTGIKILKKDLEYISLDMGWENALLGHELGYEYLNILATTRHSCVSVVCTSSPDDRKILLHVGYVLKATAGDTVFWCPQ